MVKSRGGGVEPLALSAVLGHSKFLGGGEGYSIKFYMGRFHSEVQSLTRCNKVFLTKMVPLSYTKSKIEPFSYT